MNKLTTILLSLMIPLTLSNATIGRENFYQTENHQYFLRFVIKPKGLPVDSLLAITKHIEGSKFGYDIITVGTDSSETKYKVFDDNKDGKLDRAEPYR